MNVITNLYHSERIPKLAGILVVCVSFLVLAGWEFDINLLKSVAFGFVTMKPNTAVCFLLCGFLLWILRKGIFTGKNEQRAVRVIAGALSLIGLLTLVEYVFNLNFGIDQILFRRQTSLEDTQFPGRMSPVTAFCFTLLGISFLLRTVRSQKSFYLSQCLSLSVAAVALMTIAGYVYNVQAVYKVFPFATVAVHTAICFLIVSVALLHIGGKEGITKIFFRNSPGGMLARRLTPAAILLTFFLGWLRLQGEYAGFYELEFGSALFAATNILVFTFLIWWSAASLDKTNEQSRKLQAENERLAAIVESSNDAIISKDFDGKIVSWNKGAERMFGYTAREVTGQNIKILFSPELLTEEDEILAKIRRGEYIQPYESVRLRKDGAEVQISLTVSPITNEAGEIIGASKIARDITAQRQSEAALRESENRLATVIENLSEGLIISDPDGHILLWNQASVTMHGFDDKSDLNIELRKFTEIFELSTLDGRVLDFEEWVMPRVLRGENLSDVELKISRKDKDWERIFGYGGSMIKDSDGKDVAFLSVTDITEQKRAQIAAREANKFNQQIINNAQEGIIVLDKDLRYVVWNHFLEKTTGISESDVIGKTPLEVFPDLRDNGAFEAIEKALTGETIRPMDVKIYSPNSGEERWITTTHSPNYSSNGEIVGVIITISDITERKQNEQKVVLLNESLELKVSDRTSELNAVNKELESFAFSVSHDLRAPLRAMDGFSLALMEDYADNLDETGQNYLQRIRTASKRLAQLIDDLLRLSRITRLEITKTRVNISEIAQTIAERLESDNPRENITFEIEENVYAFADRRLLQIALENLIGNAYKFTSKTDSPKIIFGQQKNGKKAEYFIKDNGAGFDMAYVDKLFTAFQRLHSTADFEGTGIGLATIQRIIRKHGGDVRAEGKVGAGATFYFTL